MRITAAKKAQTRRRIIECAAGLFAENGFDRTSTRNIAETAGIAAGTMFNYFPSKDALAAAILEDAIAAAAAEFEEKRRGEESLEELLFAQVAVELRHLEPYRASMGRALESVLSSFDSPDTDEVSSRLRRDHIESVVALIMENGTGGSAAPGAITLHLYWSLFLGVISFWSRDDSHMCEDTLAVLDHSMRLFAGSLAAES